MVIVQIGRLQAPMVIEGEHVHKEACRVVGNGLILHLFVTVQYYHDIMRYIDEGVAPDPIDDPTHEMNTLPCSWLGPGSSEKVQRDEPVPSTITEEDAAPPREEGQD